MCDCWLSKLKSLCSSICNPACHVFVFGFASKFSRGLVAKLCLNFCFYYSSVFEKRNYRLLVRVCVCVCPCLCAFVCMCFWTITQKRNQSRNMKLDYTAVYENSSDEFDIELPRIKVKVTVCVKKFSPFTTIQTVRYYSSTLVQTRNLILRMYVHLILISIR